MYCRKEKNISYTKLSILYIHDMVQKDSKDLIFVH